jgi:hypothetical protein
MKQLLFIAALAITTFATAQKVIPGLMPVDVYGNLTNKGYKLDRQMGAGGSLWTCTKSENGIDYNVTLGGDGMNVEELRINAICTAPKSALSVKQFFVYMASLQYNGASPQRAQQWLNANYNNNKATAVFGPARFTIYAPNKWTRYLNVQGI